jgi:prolyl oligopeptidase
VKDGTPYPAVLLTTGYNDARVAPWQPAKLAGRLQQASTSGKPVMLRVDFESGHGRGTTRVRRAEELADIFAFVLWQFGDPDFTPPAPEPIPAAPAMEAAPVPPTEPTTPPPPTR